MSKKFLTNGIILSAVIVFLSVYFTLEQMWGVAQVIVLLILTVSAVFQFVLLKTTK
jgi:hypothetical protein